MIGEAPGADRSRGWLITGGVLAGLAMLLAVVAVVIPTNTTVAADPPPEMLAATPVLSARRAPELVTRPFATRNLQAAVAPVIARLPAESCVEIADGQTSLVASREGAPVVPASNMKVLTAAAALDLLGPETRLVTRFAAAAPPADGTIAGDLYAVGGGDPLMTTDTYAAQHKDGLQPATDLEAVADQLVASGIRHITGSVVGDGSRYDDMRTVPGWPARFVSQGVVGNLGALIVNDAWPVDPVVPGVTVESSTEDPALHAASVVTALLQARGVQVDGQPRAGITPADTVTVLESPSLSVGELVAETLAFSDNTSAELLLKEMGKVHGGVGSTQAGVAAVQQWLADNDLPTDGVVVVDGSGLSDTNIVSCAVVSAVLQRDGTDGPVATGLARPGRPGTLNDRLTGPDLRDRVRAKTGTLRDVTALSGWLTTVPGAQLQFSLIENTGGQGVQASDIAVQGDLLRAMLTYPQSPPLEAVVPLPPAPAGG